MTIPASVFHVTSWYGCFIGIPTTALKMTITTATITAWSARRVRAASIRQVITCAIVGVLNVRVRRDTSSSLFRLPRSAFRPLPPRIALTSANRHFLVANYAMITLMLWMVRATRNIVVTEGAATTPAASLRRLTNM